MKEIADHLKDKRDILLQTYTTIKRDIHTRKQMHKMNILSQMLKKRRNQNLSCSADYCTNIDEVVEDQD